MLSGAVIGFGRMGITHFAILNSHPAVRMTAICDSSSFVARNFEKHTSVRAFSTVDDMLKSVELDFAVIGVPTVAHYEAIDRCLKHGLHVFVEKPFTLSLEEGERLVEMARRTGLVNQVGYV